MNKLWNNGTLYSNILILLLNKILKNSILYITYIYIYIHIYNIYIYIYIHMLVRDLEDVPWPKFTSCFRGGTVMNFLVGTFRVSFYWNLRMASKYSRNVHIRGGKMFIVWVSIRLKKKNTRNRWYQKTKNILTFLDWYFLTKKGNRMWYHEVLLKVTPSETKYLCIFKH